MQRILTTALLAVLAFGVRPATVSAHHSFAMFDRSAQVTIEGVVREFQFTNPHSWIQILVTPLEGGEPREWAIEALSPNVLMRSGWKKNTLKPGDRVKLLINPLRSGGPGGNLILLTLPDGTTLGGGA